MLTSGSALAFLCSAGRWQRGNCHATGKVPASVSLLEPAKVEICSVVPLGKAPAFQFSSISEIKGQDGLAQGFFYLPQVNLDRDK